MTKSFDPNIKHYKSIRSVVFRLVFNSVLCVKKKERTLVFREGERERGRGKGKGEGLTLCVLRDGRFLML